MCLSGLKKDPGNIHGNKTGRWRRRRDRTWTCLFLEELVSSSSFFLTPVILFFFGKKIEKVDEKINRTLRKVDEKKKSVGENGVETVTVAC